MKFADTHVHPLMKYVLSEKELDSWKSIPAPPKLKGLINSFVGIPAFSQSDFRRLAEGDFHIVFCALHPPEQKIMFHALAGISDGKEGTEKLLERTASQAISIPRGRIIDFRKPTYDHFEQLTEEYQLLESGSGKPQIIVKNGRNVRVSYWVCTSFQEVKTIVDRNDHDKNQFTVAVIPTVEGLHSIGLGHVDFKGMGENPNNKSEVELLDRLDQVKGIGANGWKFPPIVANLTHAFANDVCGQAQGFSQLFQILFQYAEPYGSINDPKEQDKQDGLNKPLSDLGRKLVLRMLNLDQVSENRGGSAGRRIIPDIKHMSARTRKDYYGIIDNHNQAHPDDIIPVIMSHAAVNGKARLDDHLDPTDQEREYNDSDTFNPWSINLFDDEIMRIFRTKGLIGVIFDERVLTGGRKLRKIKKAIKAHNNSRFTREQWTRVVLDHVHHIVSMVKNSGEQEWEKAWDIICIGSDFDGQINPVDSFRKATDFDKFRKEAEKVLRKDARFNALKGGLSEREIMDRICFDNVFNFLKRYF